MLARVVSRVMQTCPSERDIAHCGIKVARGKARLGEGFSADFGLWVERLGNAGSDGIKLHTRHVYFLRREADEGTGSGARLQHAASIEAKCVQCLPNLRCKCGIRVMGINNGPAGCPVLILGE